MTPHRDTKGIQLGRIVAGETHASVVYFLALPYRRREAVKIGTSTRLLSRITSVSYAATLADVLLLLPGGREVEAARHREFRDYQIDEFRELFWLKGRLKDFLDWSPPGPESESEIETTPEPVTVFAPQSVTDPRGFPLSLGDAVERGLTPGATKRSLQMDRHRSDKGQLPDGLKFPEPAGMRGEKTELFWSSELAGFNEARRGDREVSR